MTPTHKKAEDIANELVKHFRGVIWNDSLGRSHDVLDDDFTEVSIKLSIDRCDSILDVLSSVKGIGKLQKVKLYKLVKVKLEAK